MLPDRREFRSRLSALFICPSRRRLFTRFREGDSQSQGAAIPVQSGQLPPPDPCFNWKKACVRVEKTLDYGASCLPPSPITHRPSHRRQSPSTTTTSRSALALINHTLIIRRSRPSTCFSFFSPAICPLLYHFTVLSDTRMHRFNHAIPWRF